MMDLALLICAPALGGFALGWWLCRRPPSDSAAPSLSPRSPHDGRDHLAEVSDREPGLAAFYAFQLAAGKIGPSP